MVYKFRTRPTITLFLFGHKGPETLKHGDIYLTLNRKYSFDRVYCHTLNAQGGTLVTAKFIRKSSVRLCHKCDLKNCLLMTTLRFKGMHALRFVDFITHYSLRVKDIKFP